MILSALHEHFLCTSEKVGLEVGVQLETFKLVSLPFEFFSGETLGGERKIVHFLRAERFKL